MSAPNVQHSHVHVEYPVELSTFSTNAPVAEVVSLRERGSPSRIPQNQETQESRWCSDIDFNECSEMSSSKKCMIACGTVLALLVGSAILIAVSLKRLESYETGLKYHTIRKDLEEEARNEGLHMGEPGFNFVIFPNVFKTLRWNTFRCVNFDGVDIFQDLSFQYKIRSTKIYDIVLEFRDYDGYMEMIKNIADTVIHEACSQFTTSEFQSARSQFQSKMREIMFERLKSIGTHITDLQINDLRRPGKFESAIREKEAAKESIEVAVNERPRQRTQAETKRLEADTQARILINRATADATIATTKARAEAEGINHQYETELKIYKDLQSRLSLSTEALLSYMATEVVTSPDQEGLYINMEAPAATAYTQA